MTHILSWCCYLILYVEIFYISQFSPQVKQNMNSIKKQNKHMYHIAEIWNNFTNANNTEFLH